MELQVRKEAKERFPCRCVVLRAYLTTYRGFSASYPLSSAAVLSFCGGQQLPIEGLR